MSFVRLPTAGISILLGGVCAGLLFVLTLLTTGNLPQPESQIPPGPALEPPEMPVLMQVSAEATASADKPLFHVDRKPYQDRRTATETAGTRLSDTSEAPFTLKGVLLSDGMARASLYSNTDGDIRWINRGDAIDGWQLVQVRPANVVLARGEHRTTLALYPARSAGLQD